MKRTAFVVCLLALVVTPAWAGGIGLTGSWWDTSDAGDDAGWGVFIDLPVTGKSPVDLDFRYTSFRKFEGPTALEVYSLDVEPIEFGASYNFNREGTVSPFLGAGLGYYLLRAQRYNSPHDLDVQNENGYYFVGGVDIPTNGNWTFVGEVMYRLVKTQLEGEGLADFDVQNVDLTGVAVNVGVAWRW